MSRLGRRIAPVVVTVIAAIAVIAGLAYFRVLPGRDVVARFLSERSARMERERRTAEFLSRFAIENRRAADGSVVLIGSSTIERGPWGEIFPSTRILNRGIGGETALDLGARLKDSLPDAKPAGIFVYAGAADLRFDGATPREAARRVAAVCDALSPRHGLYMTVPVAIIEVLSEVAPTPERLADVRALNASLAVLAAEHGFAFVRTSVPPLVDADGRLPAALSSDGVHLNDAGYRALADRMRIDGGAAALALR